MFTIHTRPAVIAGVLITAVTLVGCSTTEADSQTNTVVPGGNAHCKPPLQPTITADTPTIAILGVQGGTLTAYDQDTSTVLQSATHTESRVIVNGVSGADHAPNLLSNVVLKGEGNNNLARTRDINCKTATVNEAIDTLKKGKSSKTQNVFDALNALAGNLSQNPSRQPVDVVLLTSLVALGGGIDLNNPKTLSDPVTAINALAAKGLIPSCQNWRIYGVSPSTGLNDVMAAQLKDFWIRYANRCGGALVAWEDHLATFPVTSAIAAADTSQMKVVQTKTQVTATLGSDVLFPPDSATLNSSAPALFHLLKLANKYTGKIEITGYINPTGATTDAGTNLSRQRAVAVRDWLQDHKIEGRRISVDGKGAADPIYPHPKTDAQSAANRRVVTVIHTEA